MKSKSRFTLADLFTENTIKLDLQSSDKWNAVNELAKLLYKENRITSMKEFIAAVKEREEQISTSVGLGIAIPHGISNSARIASVALGRSGIGVRWDADKDDICHLILLLAIPSSERNETYIRLLANLARSLVHEEFREFLLAAQTPIAILDRMSTMEFDMEL